MERKGNAKDIVNDDGHHIFDDIMDIDEEADENVNTAICMCCGGLHVV